MFQIDKSFTALTREQILELAVGLAARHKRLTSAEYVMQKFGILTHGIERVECAGKSIRYVNVGETYDPTVYAQGGEYFAGSWGQWYETTENEHCEAEDVIRCAYCGEFTPLCDKALAEPKGARHSWNETICEHCGRNVSDGSKAETVSADDDELDE